MRPCWLLYSASFAKLASEKVTTPARSFQSTQSVLKENFEVTSLQGKFYNPVGGLQALNCALEMAATLKFIHTISKIWPTIATDPSQSSYHTAERSQFLLSQGVIHLSIFSNCGWLQVPSVVSNIHMTCAIIVLRKAGFVDRLEVRAVDLMDVLDCIHPFTGNPLISFCQKSRLLSAWHHHGGVERTVLVPFLLSCLQHTLTGFFTDFVDVQGLCDLSVLCCGSGIGTHT